MLMDCACLPGSSDVCTACHVTPWSSCCKQSTRRSRPDLPHAHCICVGSIARAHERSRPAILSMPYRGAGGFRVGVRRCDGLLPRRGGGLGGRSTGGGLGGRLEAARGQSARGGVSQVQVLVAPGCHNSGMWSRRRQLPRLTPHWQASRSINRHDGQQVTAAWTDAAAEQPTPMAGEQL